MGVLDLFRLDGKVALVTGASSGLGVEFACALAEAGADVALAARRVDGLDRTRGLVEERGRRAIAVRTDVSDPDACEAAVAATIDELGRLDVLVNNAGVGEIVPFLRESSEHFRRVVEVDLSGAAWMAGAAAARMEPGSSIVNVSSVVGLTTAAGAPQASYAAAKAGLIGLTRDLAHQWTGRRGVRVNALSPGFFATELTADLEDALTALVPRIPAGRIGDPKELAAALVFLASDAAAYVTAENLVVDGGFVSS
jgi:NAD(P)-dependent dehydrogenase (short-subunit alcohol dehydrogenase family)